MTRAIGALSIALVVAFGCSDDEDATSGSGGNDAGGMSSSGGAGASTPTESCVQPGDVGNENGVGQHCTPAGGECNDFPEAGLCLADVAQDQWFCTRVGCDETTDCGMEAGCQLEASGSACVPCRCSPDAFGCGSGGAGGGGGNGGSGG